MSYQPTTGALLFLYTESPLHVGAGTGLGAIDLPIQRERFSKLPVVPGSGLKGALREELSRHAQGDPGEEKAVKALFGPEAPSGKMGSRDAPEFAGACSLVDARLLLLPVRAARGGWAWLTSPMCLQRLLRDLETLGEKAPSWADIPDPGEGALVGTGSVVTLAPAPTSDARPGSTKEPERILILEDDAFNTQTDPRVDVLASWLGRGLPDTPAYAPYRKRLPGQLVIVSDTTLTDLAERATEVSTRVRLDADTRTVQTGALWTEEALPPEALLWSLVLFSGCRMFEIDDKDEKGARKPVKGSARDTRRWFLQLLGEAAPIERKPEPQKGKGASSSGNDVPGEEADMKDLKKRGSPLRRLQIGGDQGTGRGLVGLRAWSGEGA